MSNFRPTASPVAGPTAESLIKRAFLFLEDGDFQNADMYSERVLDMDPVNGDAYLVKLLIQFRVRNIEQLQNQPYRLDPSKHYQKILRFGNHSLKQRLEIINHTIVYNTANRAMHTARNDAEFKKAAAMFNEIASFRDAAHRRDECYARANAIIMEIQARQRAAYEQKRMLEEQRRRQIEFQQQQYIRQQQMMEEQRRQQYIQQQQILEQQRQAELQRQQQIEAQRRAAMEAQKQQIEEEQKRIIEENKRKIAEAQALKEQQEAQAQAELMAKQQAEQAKIAEKEAKENEKAAKKAAKVAEKEAKAAAKLAEKEAKRAAKEAKKAAKNS